MKNLDGFMYMYMYVVLYRMNEIVVCYRWRRHALSN